MRGDKRREAIITAQVLRLEQEQREEREGKKKSVDKRRVLSLVVADPGIKPQKKKRTRRTMMMPAGRGVAQ